MIMNAVKLKVWIVPLGWLMSLLVQPADAADIPVSTADAQAGAYTPDTVYVWGKREEGIGEVVSASEGTVSFGEFADRPLLRTGEIAEVIPGLAVTQHSGTGKANQYFLRGFNLDHGTDFSVSLDGMPLNLRTNAHGQGYLDLNLLIPELVETIQYRKGPYFAAVGDFSAAGSASFISFAQPPAGFAALTLGEHDYGRLSGVKSLDEATYVALDLTTSNGPWQRSEALRKGNFLIHHTTGDWAFTGLAYSAKWNSTDQIPLRAVQDGPLSYLGFIDPTDGGETSRFLVSARMQDGDGLDAVLYAQKYRLKLWSNFTYFLDDPDHGDQFEQAEDRWIAGGSISKKWAPDNNIWNYQVGAETRYDRIGKIGLYRTQARQILSTDREDRVHQGSAGVWTSADWKLNDWRGSLGLRLDEMGVNVSSSNPLNSGTSWQGIVSPKITLAYRAASSLEFYADIGRGYHSNDARGAVATVAPVSGEPISPVNLYVPAWGGELGARWEQNSLTASTSLWMLKLDSELVYSGDGGDTESTNATTRVGAEFLLNWTPVHGINLELSAASTHARYDDAPGAERIPNAIEYVVTGGVTAALTPKSTAEMTLRRLGPAPLIEDGSVSSRPSTLTNLLYRYRFDRLSLTLEVLNVFDRRDDDITYYYTSRLPGEADAGVDDIHFHPMEPRTFRVGVKVPW